MLATLNTAKQFMGIPDDDKSQDPLIIAALKAASASIEREVNRSFEYKQYQQTLDGSGTQFLRLRNFPIQSVSMLKLNGHEQAQESYVIETENGMLFRRTGWPSGTRSIEVEYMAGYILPSDEMDAESATLPENISLACILYAQMLMRTPGVTSERVGDISVNYKDDGDGLPAAVKALIRL
ncbi:phage gp6-like head-tail connector protein [Paenibacillus sp. KQZ6P-2]|uniref:Phage gp6-like head-tail connector protein n=1 Tax=Paenibacillus mangrovi TaxID=2931978 RepID=A0A9X1WTY3_9BACL|nr:head-tail connector protein [Paenibacillus mangrovi]MCJ8015232.1 phage gp6-like head-tail connector protein [Paenibacillus mangrovi]